ncbi:u2 snrnp component ist3 [Grosmannia clavigera kw1407]|uniref:U2 snrnp component ist3 n=1 Tax=Grosmannia clavigera (strain kw1407 / UAMH 11150) TaxID=655863 RepID=F0XK89_GROCL|nr:u2 snrnp component ist3 [Grosmannia clavigera kw1407]EFX01907.1 u2 snrnp component ist3 [Grosmannia clavigera kw1407]
MNKIRQIQELNKKELEQGISPQASWHTDYRDTAFVYFGGLPFELSEGDVITIFSQYGEPVFLKLARDRETGKSKGFGWLKYEDQRSTDLAVDNLGGASISGRLIHVDHARYKARDDEDLDEYKVGWEDIRRREGIVDATAGGNSETDGDGKYETESDTEKRRQHHRRRVGKGERPMLPEERELEQLIRDHDDEDPMKEYLIDEKKKEIEAALRRIEDGHGDEGKDRRTKTETSWMLTQTTKNTLPGSQRDTRVKRTTSESDITGARREMVENAATEIETVIGKGTGTATVTQAENGDATTATKLQLVTADESIGIDTVDSGSGMTMEREDSLERGGMESNQRRSALYLHSCNF